MKTLLSLLIIIIVMSSCSNDGNSVPGDEIKIFTKEIVYDSQDNVISIDGQWVRSINLLDSLPANETLAVYIATDTTLILTSINYDIAAIRIEGFEYDVAIEISNNKGTIISNKLRDYQYYTDLFYLEIDFYQY